MKAEIKGGNLIITIPIEAELKESTTGKTLTLASSKGFQKTELVHQGKPVSVSVNAYIKKG
jgi:hypothetical protein